VATVALATLGLLAAPAAAAPPTSAPLRVAKVDGARIAYRVLNPEASGRPLVMICGYGLTMAEWDPRLLEGLARERTVLVYDNRGIGNSRGPVKGLTVGEMADDTIALIRSLGIERADLLGWSMGGYIAQRVAIKAPRLVGRLILASTDPGSPAAVEPAERVVRTLTEPAESEDALLPILFPPSRQASGGAWLAAIGRQPHLTGADFRTPAATMRQQAQAAGARWYGRGHGTYATLARIEAPTLVAYGADDVIVPPANARLLAHRIDKSKLLRVPDGGHAFLFQEPAAKARAFGAFLDVQEAPRSWIPV
jgi:pimeloyl-ACP methyl ester carboxylesterase